MSEIEIELDLFVGVEKLEDMIVIVNVIGLFVDVANVIEIMTETTLEMVIAIGVAVTDVSDGENVITDSFAAVEKDGKIL